MSKLTTNGVTWYTIESFMHEYKIKSTATVYKRVREGKVVRSKILNSVVFKMA